MQYPTSWAGEITFEQIYADLALYATNVMKRNGIQPHQLEECLQIGMMAHWQQLAAQPDVLAENTRRQTVSFILARCMISTIREQEGRYDRLEPLVDADWRGNGDGFAILGLEANRDERWAAWATHITLRTDIKRILCQFATKYEDSLPHLVALYALTTNVTYRDAASILGLSRPFRWIRTVVESLRIELQLVFAELLEQRVVESLNPVASSMPRPDAPHAHGATNIAQATRHRRSICYASMSRMHGSLRLCVSSSTAAARTPRSRATQGAPTTPLAIT